MTHDTGRSERRRLDWPAIRNGFLAGESYAALGRRFGCRADTISRKAKKDGWARPTTTVHTIHRDQPIRPKTRAATRGRLVDRLTGLIEEHVTAMEHGLRAMGEAQPALDREREVKAIAALITCLDKLGDCEPDRANKGRNASTEPQEDATHARDDALRARLAERIARLGQQSSSD